MTFQSTDSNVSILEDGRLKPGVYKIQNIHCEKYLDIHEHSNAVCCRPAPDLRDGKGLWEIKRLGDGYTVRRIDPGKPEQFCTTVEGLSNGTTLHVAPYPVAWRIEARCYGSEHLRFYWGATQKTWDSYSEGEDERSKVRVWDEHKGAWQTWKLIPVKVETVFAPTSLSSGNLDSSSLPSYNGGVTGQSTTRTQHVESERDGFGTIVNEVTVVTTNTSNTVTTHKRYRVADT